MGAFLFILLWAVPLTLGIMIRSIVEDPVWFVASVLADRSERKRKRDRVVSELDRKFAIADAAIAVRARGESFTPPADYDR